MYLLAAESLLVWEVDQVKCNLLTLVLVRTSQKLWSDALVLPLPLLLVPPTLYFEYQFITPYLYVFIPPQFLDKGHHCVQEKG
jgi:hypothetical protein